MHIVRFYGLLAATVFAKDVIGVSPALPNYGSPVSSTTALQHTFGNSWGSPASVPLAAPGVDFTHVQLEIQLSVSGVQYDRLIHIYVNDVEVWRPSTPEPANDNVNANMTKDVSHLAALFRTTSTVTFQLDNVQDSTYTGAFDCSLLVHYYNQDSSDKTEQQWFYDGSSGPSSVTALSKQLANAPPDVGVTVPKQDGSVYRLGIEVFASGNGDEEFWYTKAQSGSGPTRLIEVYVGSTIAGIIDPFQPIYTGGIQPSMWSPIVGVNTYDVPSYYIDISAFLPNLWSSSESLTLKFVNGYSSTAVDSSWLVNVALLAWTDNSKTGTGGQITESTSNGAKPVIVSGSSSSGSVSYIGLQNSVTVKATLEFNDGSSSNVEWQQSSNAVNAQLNPSKSPEYYLSYAHGTSSYSSGSTTLSRTHTYPLGIYLTGDETSVDQAYIVSNSGSSGTSSVNNNVLSTWGGSMSDKTTAVCTWTDGGTFTRTASATKGNLDSDNTGAGSGNFAGSWASTVSTLAGYASGNNLESLGSALSGYAASYASGEGQPTGQWGAQGLNAREVSPFVGRTFHPRDVSPFVGRTFYKSP